jgi:hypothetical protein
MIFHWRREAVAEHWISWKQAAEPGSWIRPGQHAPWEIPLYMIPSCNSLSYLLGRQVALLYMLLVEVSESCTIWSLKIAWSKSLSYVFINKSKKTRMKNRWEERGKTFCSTRPRVGDRASWKMLKDSPNHFRLVCLKSLSITSQVHMRLLRVYTPTPFASSQRFPAICYIISSCPKNRGGSSAHSLQSPPVKTLVPSPSSCRSGGKREGTSFLRVVRVRAWVNFPSCERIFAKWFRHCIVVLLVEI